jgi:hypothetical protein
MKNNQSCINCGTALHGNFCAECGQKAHIKRISIKLFFEDYLGRLFGMDTGFLRTVRDLTIRPGVVGNTFVKGNRVKYIGPVGYFFLINTFLILAYQMLDINIKEFIVQSSNMMVDQPDVSGKAAEMQSMMLETISDNLKLFSFLMIPFYAMWGKVFFRKSKYNLIEHGVNSLYVQGHMALVSIIMLLVYKFSGLFIGPYESLINFVVFIWSCLAFYEVRGVKNILKGAFLYIVVFITFSIFIGAGSVLFMVLFNS